ncbi:MAG: SGNH/GDSL hydrolase family protein [Sedimentisphaerales bacterium]|nr:SGNH/GDSL hydrolase family protein [Sedimentisphaerales bacterium]
MANKIIVRCILYLGVLMGLVSCSNFNNQDSFAEENLATAKFAAVNDNPALPRVLLIGDSISIGYTVPLRKILQGKANIHRIPENGRSTRHGLKQITQWLGKKKWDVIHFNWGLHDISLRTIPADEYEKNLTKLVRKLKATGAKLIWATTTPVPQGAAGRIKGDEVAYNAIAQKIMVKNEIFINDLYSFALPRLLEIQMEQNVHFTPDGYVLFAQQVADSILNVLRSKQKN